jgi:SAM-dependent methyltransferase
MDFSNIRFVTGSGTDLDFKDSQFDFCWSMSSIEHFGGHDAAARSMREIARVTKPGGIVAIATEYLLLPDQDHPEFFNKLKLQESIVGASEHLRLVSPIDFNTVPHEYLIDSVVIPAGMHRCRRHVVLNDGNVQWTSIMLFFQKRR